MAIDNQRERERARTDHHRRTQTTSRFIELLNLLIVRCEAQPKQEIKKKEKKQTKKEVLTSQRPINLTNAEIIISFRNNYTIASKTILTQCGQEEKHTENNFNEF